MILYGARRTKKRICIKFALCKYVESMSFAQLCTQCKCGDGRICPFLCKFGHRHLCTGCKALQISYLQHICTRQIWGKYDFSSSDVLTVSGRQRGLKTALNTTSWGMKRHAWLSEGSILVDSQSITCQANQELGIDFFWHSGENVPLNMFVTSFP